MNTTKNAVIEISTPIEEGRYRVKERNPMHIEDMGQGIQLAIVKEPRWPGYEQTIVSAWLRFSGVGQFTKASRTSPLVLEVARKAVGHDAVLLA